MESERRKIDKLLQELRAVKLCKFPSKGGVRNTGVPMKQGVYVIYNPHGAVVHVGRTLRARRGLQQRLNNHLSGKSAFVRNYLKGSGSKLREGYKLRYLVIDDPRTRALLEALATGVFCPRHIGLGQ